VIPGDEMLTAISFAQSHQLPLQLIDMDAQKVFSSLLSQMSLRERLRFVFSSVLGVFVSKEKVEAELDSIQGDFDRYLDEIGKKFPTIKEVLIDKRNRFMVDRLVKLDESFERVVACVGDGHVPGMKSLLEDAGVGVGTIRLSELQKGTRQDRDASSASFHIEYENLS
jgi:pheromone shutdown protein TraB